MASDYQNTLTLGLMDAANDDLSDNIQEAQDRLRSLSGEEQQENTTMVRIENLNDSIISSAVVTLAFLPIFNFNLDVELGNFVVVIGAIYMLLNMVNLYLAMHQERLNKLIGIPFTNTLIKGFFWTTQGLFFYGLNILKPRLIGLNLNPIYILYFLWFYIGFWEIIRNVCKKDYKKKVN